MSGISIDTSSIGYDETGISEIVKTINEKIVETTIETLKKNVPDLEQRIYTCWKGKAADKFIEKLYSDTNIVLDCLAQLENSINDSFYQMMYNTANSDNEIAASILNSNYSSSGNMGAAPTTVPTVVLEKKGKTTSNNNESSDNPLIRGLATVGTFGTGFLEGAVDFGESLVDTGATLLTGVASIGTGIYDGLGYLGSYIAGKDYDPITDDMWRVTQSFVGTDYSTQWADSFYDGYGEGLKTNAYYYDEARNLGHGVGYTVTMGASIWALHLGAPALAGSLFAKHGVNALTMGLTGFATGIGNGAEKGWANGGSLLDGFKEATKSSIGDGLRYALYGKISTMAPFDGGLKDFGFRGVVNGVSGPVVKGFVGLAASTLAFDAVSNKGGRSLKKIAQSISDFNERNLKESKAIKNINTNRDYKGDTPSKSTSGNSIATGNNASAPTNTTPKKSDGVVTISINTITRDIDPEDTNLVVSVTKEASNNTTTTNTITKDTSANNTTPTNTVMRENSTKISAPISIPSDNTRTTTPVNNNSNNTVLPTQSYTSPISDAQSISTQSFTNTGNDYVDLINQIRADNGLNPLSINNNLVSAASIRAEEASQYWSHTRPDGSKWNTVSPATTGENLAFGYNNANDCIDAWMNSPTHKSVLLADDISSAGLVVYEKDGVQYVALEVA